MKGSKTGWAQPAIQGVDLFVYPFEKTKSIFSGRVTANQGGVLTMKFPSSLGIEIIEGQDLMIQHPERNLVCGFKVIKNTKNPLTDAVTLKAELSHEFGEWEKPEYFLTNWIDQKVQVIPLDVWRREPKASLVLTVVPNEHLPGLADTFIWWDRNKNDILDPEEGQKIKENLHTKIETADGLRVKELQQLLPGFIVMSAKYRPSFPVYMEQTMLFPQINLRVMPAGEDKIYFDFPEQEVNQGNGLTHNNWFPDGERFSPVFLEDTLIDVRKDLQEAEKKQKAEEIGEKKVRRQETEVQAKEIPLNFSTLIDKHGTMLGKFQIAKLLMIRKGSKMMFRMVGMRARSLSLWRLTFDDNQNIDGASLMIERFRPVIM